MKRLIPGSLALQAFESAARHLSFTRAAVELCVTPGAISRQIAALEGQLGVTLFARMRQRLQLTDAGRAYLARVAPALRELAAASTELLIHRGAGGVLRIASLPTFNAKWLVPRLPRFAQAQPQVRLEFFPFVQGYDFSRPDLDCAIRYGAGAWPGAASEYIDGRELVVVGAVGAPRRALDPAQATLLHHVSVPQAWAEWLRAAGMSAVNAQAGPRFDQYSVLMQAAAAGLGLALVPRCLAADELAARRLALAAPQPVQLAEGYWLCYPEARAALPALVAFRDWVRGEAAAAPAVNPPSRPSTSPRRGTSRARRQ